MTASNSHLIDITQSKLVVVEGKDEKEVFREGLARLLEEQEHIEVVSRCSSGKQDIEGSKKQSLTWF